MKKTTKNKEVKKSPRNKKIDTGTYEEVGTYVEGEAPEEETGVVIHHEHVTNNIADTFIQQAIAKKIDVETLRGLIELRKKLNDEIAKEAFNTAMAAFQAECPIVEKRKMAKDDNNNRDLYKYAPLDDIVSQTKDIIGKHGFSYTFRQENDGTTIKVSCIVSHKAGHTEVSIMETGLATKTRMMSSPQQVAATLTFNKRYAFCNAFGIMTGDEDVDASKVIVESETPAPVTAPARTPAPAPNVQDDVITRITKMLGNTSDVFVIKEFQGKIAASDKYTDEEKATIDTLIEARIQTLGAPIEPTQQQL